MVCSYGVEIKLAQVKKDSGAEVGEVPQGAGRAFQNGNQAFEAFGKGDGQGMRDIVDESLQMTPQGFGHLFHLLQLFASEDCGPPSVR